MKKTNLTEPQIRRFIEELSRGGPVAITAQSAAGRVNIALSVLQESLSLMRDQKLLADGDALAINPDFGTLVGFDMGASHLHFALADFSGELIAEQTEKIRPEDGFEKIAAQIKKGVHSISDSGSRPLRAIAAGVPSPVDPHSGAVLLANNLTGWANVDLKSELEDELRVPVVLENDANMAAIGEHWRGVAQSDQCFVFIALGTGIGGGVFVDGRIHPGRTGNAGELRLLQVEWQRWQEDFGDTGYFETHASGQGIARLGRELMNIDSSAGSLAEKRDALFVFDAFRRGDVQAREVLERIFTILGVGIENVVAILDPDRVVLGGGVSGGAPELMLATVERVLRKSRPDPPPVCLSALGGRAQIYGAVFSALNAAVERTLL